MLLLSPYWENLDKEKGNISLIQKYDCLVEAEIEQHGGLGAKSIQDLEQTTVRQCLCYIYVCIYVRIRCSCRNPLPLVLDGLW